MFWRNLLPHHKFQDEVTKFYQNISTHEPNYWAPSYQKDSDLNPHTCKNLKFHFHILYYLEIPGNTTVMSQFYQLLHTQNDL